MTERESGLIGWERPREVILDKKSGRSRVFRSSEESRISQGVDRRKNHPNWSGIDQVRAIGQKEEENYRIRVQLRQKEVSFSKIS